jgi:CheY-like chemotaxis protein
MRDIEWGAGQRRHLPQVNSVAKFITIIDDDSEDASFLQSAILAVDPSVICVVFNSPQEAVERISASKIPPDIIFVDYNMPAFNGIECLQIFNALRKLNYTSYVAISSHMPPALEQAFLNNGVSCAFEKPTSIQGYQRVVEQVFSNTYAVVK